MVFKKWIQKQVLPDMVQDIAEKRNIPLMAARVLAARGLSVTEAEEFFSGALEDPFVLKDMDKATMRITQAIEKEEKIVIYGDYDCDGVTATALLYTYLNSVGANVMYYVPDRETEGYGLNCQALAFLKDRLHTDLVITVDNGISALKEAAYAREKGLDLVITDHHSVGETLPDAVAVINPHRKDCPSRFKELAGVGVVFKLVAALEGGDYTMPLESFADLAAIGTIGDVVTLSGENRLLVQQGLKILEFTENPGLRALLEIAGLEGKPITAASIAFGIAPRINAAGRIEGAEKAVDLLLCEDEEEATALAAEMQSFNQQRQEIEQKILHEIEQEIEKNPGKLYNRVLVFWGEGWHPGVIGIVSAKITERYGKPSFILSVQGQGDSRGSGRSIGNFSLYEALSACAAHLKKFGGHQLAAGLSVERGSERAFEEAINRYAAEHFAIMPTVTCEIDAEISLQELSAEIVGSLSVLEPFGAGNPQPIFLMRKAVIESITPLSVDKHLRIRVSFDGGMVPVVYFGMSSRRFPYSKGQAVDLLVNVEMNMYHGVRSVSVRVRDLRPANLQQQKLLNAKSTYEAIRRGENYDVRLRPRILPQYEEFVAVYKYIRARGGYSGDLDVLYFELGQKLNYCKFRVVLDVMEELQLIALSPLLDHIQILPTTGKVDLNTSIFLQKIAASGQQEAK